MSSNLPPRQHLALFFLTLALAAVALLPGHAAGQATPSSPTPSTTAPTTTSEDPASQGLQRRPLGIEETQPDAHEEYLLGAGDDIVVTVAGRPELSGPQVVGPDGRITLPVIGSVLVGEKSRDDASKAINEAVE